MHARKEEFLALEEEDDDSCLDPEKEPSRLVHYLTSATSLKHFAVSTYSPFLTHDIEPPHALLTNPCLLPRLACLHIELLGLELKQKCPDELEAPAEVGLAAAALRPSLVELRKSQREEDCASGAGNTAKETDQKSLTTA